MGIFLSKASTATSSRPSWARVYSTTLGVRGGAAASTAETVGGEAELGSAAVHPASMAAVKDPFRHLPGLEVCVGFHPCCGRGLSVVFFT